MTIWGQLVRIKCLYRSNSATFIDKEAFPVVNRFNNDVWLLAGGVVVIALLGWLVGATEQRAKVAQAAKTPKTVSNPSGLPTMKRAADYLAVDVKPTDRNLEDILARVYQIEVFGRNILDRAQHDEDVRLILEENPGLRPDSPGDPDSLGELKIIFIPIKHRNLRRPAIFQAEYDSVYKEDHGAETAPRPPLTPEQTTRPKN